MREVYDWFTGSPLGIFAGIGLLIVVFTLVGAFYEWRTRRMYPDKGKRRKKR